MMTRAVALLLWLPVAAAAAGPSFDCAEATGQAQEAVCASPDLSALDRQLAARFDEALAVITTLGPAADAAEIELRTAQRGWIGGRDACWREEDLEACVRREYERRITTLIGQYLLEVPERIVTYRCDGAAEIVAYFFDTDPAGIRLEIGDRIDTGTYDADAGRYEASFGTWLQPTDEGARAQIVLGGIGDELDCRQQAETMGF